MCRKPYQHGITRRDFLRISALVPVAAGLPRGNISGSVADGLIGNVSGTPSAPLAVAEAAAAWIHSKRIETEHGVTWPADPRDPHTSDLTLYHGSPGVILFLLELHHATGSEAYLEEARRGADHLMALAASGKLIHPGLYTGLAGMAFTIAEVHRATGEGHYREGALFCVDQIVSQARPASNRVAWHDGNPEDIVTDIVGGSAGIGLALLYAHDVLGHPDALQVARDAAPPLLALARESEGGLKWPMSPSYPRLMPNFSHGTAGVAYFLARLYEVTGDQDLLDGALQGASYLTAASRNEGRGSLIFHHEPEGEDLFYLGWCHGPTGTARLFYQLSQVVGDEDLMLWPRRGARGIMDQGVPELRVEGLWNNVSQCCGDAGVGDFFLSLHDVSGDDSYLHFVDRIERYLTDQCEEDGSTVGTRWVQAEHRTQPENVVAQTGWMQGAAGVGAFFVHLDGKRKGRPDRILPPDSPWRCVTPVADGGHGEHVT